MFLMAIWGPKIHKLGLELPNIMNFEWKKISLNNFQSKSTNF